MTTYVLATAPRTNMGSMTRAEIDRFASVALQTAGFYDIGWRTGWTKAAPSICMHGNTKILMHEGIIGRYPWECKEGVLHEMAHIETWPEDSQHGEVFYLEYTRLLNLMMLNRRAR